MATSTSSGKIGIEVQFGAFRKEIEYRTQAQSALISLTLSIAALAGGLMVRNNHPGYLVLLALFSPAIGMLWLDHAFTIDDLGDRCRGMRFEWEDDVWKKRRHWLRRWLFGIQIMLLFGGPAFAALIGLRALQGLRLGWPEHPLEWGCTIATLLLVIWTTLMLYYVFGPATRGFISSSDLRIARWVRRRLGLSRRPTPRGPNWSTSTTDVK